MRSRLFAGAALIGLIPGPMGLFDRDPEWMPAAVQDDWCSESNYGDDEERWCVVRELRMAAPRIVEVDADPNGGIRVLGSSRTDVLVLARVEAKARTTGRAREIVEAVRVVTAPRIEVSGPDVARREHFSVSFRLDVPRRSNLRLSSTNGGISIAGVTGEIEAQTSNGGLRLENLGGDVRARTSNGGVRIDLAGSSWDGAGLDVRTSNGSVTLNIPDAYSAELETGTTNGSFESEIPLMVSGRIDRELRTRLGQGGAPIRAVTTNGSVRIKRAS